MMLDGCLDACMSFIDALSHSLSSLICGILGLHDRGVANPGGGNMPSMRGATDRGKA
jgi:hypothetical protein